MDSERPATRLDAHGLAPRTHDCPPPPTALPPRRFTVRFERLFNLRGCRPGETVRLRLPRPIEDRALSALEVRPLFDGRFSAAPGRLDARIEVPPALEVELGFEADFTAYPSGGEADTTPLGAADRALYTRPHDGMIKVDEAVQRLAADLAGAERDPWSQVERFWDFGFERLRYGVVHYDEIDLARPAPWALENIWCDCQLGSGLLAALCRARGIPARLVAGYLMDADTPDRHYWAEAWIEERGWQPLDLSSSWSYSRGGRDPAWRNYYFGQLDYRMKTEVLPHLFNGPGRAPLSTGLASALQVVRPGDGDELSRQHKRRPDPQRPRGDSQLRRLALTNCPWTTSIHSINERSTPIEPGRWARPSSGWTSCWTATRPTRAPCC